MVKSPHDVLKEVYIRTTTERKLDISLKHAIFRDALMGLLLLFVSNGYLYCQSQNKINGHSLLSNIICFTAIFCFWCGKNGN